MIGEALKGGDAEANAAMTLREFDLWFALEICRYNNSITSGAASNTTPPGAAHETASDPPPSGAFTRGTR